jgi:hypothetical protein
MNRAAHGVDAHSSGTWLGNAREFDCAYPEVNAACLAKLFASTRRWAGGDPPGDRAPRDGEMELLAGWLDRADTALGIGVVEVMSPRVETPRTWPPASAPRCSTCPRTGWW